MSCSSSHYQYSLQKRSASKVSERAAENICHNPKGEIPIDRGSDRPIIEKGPLDRGSDRPIIEMDP